MIHDRLIQREAERQFDLDTWWSRIGLALAVAIGPLMLWAYCSTAQALGIGVTSSGTPQAYRVHYGPSPTQLWHTIDLAPAPTLHVNGLGEGTWFFCARFVTATGEQSPCSNIVSRVAGKQPNAPTNFGFAHNAGIPSPVPVTYAPSYGGAVFRPEF